MESPSTTISTVTHASPRKVFEEEFNSKVSLIKLNKLVRDVTKHLENLELTEAAKRFDAERGRKFITYAVWWIRQAILKALAEQSRIVRLPLNRVGTLHKIGKVSSSLEQTYGRNPSPDEIAKKLELSENEVADTLKR